MIEEYLNKLNNEEIERAVIGQCLLDGAVPLEGRALATSDFIYHRALFEAILEIDADGKEISVFDVQKVLKRENPQTPHDVASLTKFYSGLPNRHNVTPLVNELRELSCKRDIVQSFEGGARSLANGGSIESVLGVIGDKVERARSTQVGGFRSLRDIVDRDVKPDLQNLKEGIHNKIPLGWSNIDVACGGGLSRSDVMVVAALPGIGKSAFVLQMATSMAKKGYPVAFYSAEMTEKENVYRMLTQESGLWNLNAATHLHESDYGLAVQWAEHIAPLPLFLDTRSVDLRTLSLHIRRAVKDNGIQVAVIDYIQLLKLDRTKSLRRYERITEVSQELRRLAIELNIAIVAVAQFNREGAKSMKPTMHDLEGSSQLEKDASLIFVIDRDPADQSYMCKLRIEKGRNTGHAVIEGRFERKALKYEF